MTFTSAAQTRIVHDAVREAASVSSQTAASQDAATPSSPEPEPGTDGCAAVVDVLLRLGRQG